MIKRKEKEKINSTKRLFFEKNREKSMKQKLTKL